MFKFLMPPWSFGTAAIAAIVYSISCGVAAGYTYKALADMSVSTPIQRNDASTASCDNSTDQ